MRREQLLVEVSELSDLCAAGTAPVLLDVRWSPAGPSPREQYEAGHLPGAVRADLERDLSSAAGPRGRHPLPEVAAFQAAARRMGVRDDRPVVAYDQRDATISARLWWLLRYFGHADVRVLDGGFDAWEAAGLPVEAGVPPRPAAGDFTADPGHLPMLTVDDVPALSRRGTLLDCRLAARYRGEVEPLDPVAGHIPGAVSAPTFDNSLPDGRLRPAADLHERFTRLGVAPGGEVAAYCGSGVTAAHQVLALRLAGFDAALYVGSWSEWIADPGRPVAVGAS